METEILDANPNAEINVYAIWVPMLFSDGRNRWDPDLLIDARVQHFWDQDRISGTWFAENVLGFSSIAWDIYFLYPEDATWLNTPSPLLVSGSPVISQKGDLLEALKSMGINSNP